jgi:hypothetical protein
MQIRMGERNRAGKSLPQHWRDKIQAGMLLGKLSNHAMGECDMSATQVQAARILLAKVFPDLKATEHSIDEDTRRLLGAIIVPLKSVQDATP